MYQLLVFFLLFLTWMIFSGLFDLFHLSLGVLACAFVTWMSSRMLFEDRSCTLAGRVGQLWRLTAYFFWLLGQIVIANVHILRLALSPKGMRDVKPSIVRVHGRLRTDFEKFLLAQSITLTPGTVTVKIEEDEFVIHAISQLTADSLDGTMERRIAAIFRPDEPLTAREGVGTG